MSTARTASRISVERPDAARLKELGVSAWPIWTKEPSTFPWRYEEPETCYFLSGEVRVTTAEGDVMLRTGDLVTFPKGLECTWRVTQPVRKHYHFG